MIDAIAYVKLLKSYKKKSEKDTSQFKSTFTSPLFDSTMAYSVPNNSNFACNKTLPNTNYNLHESDNDSYDDKIGTKLAAAAHSGATGFRGKCSKAVSEAIESTYHIKLGYGNADTMPERLLASGKFIEINSDNLAKLPAGCVLCYAPKVAGYSSKYGHTEITDGKGCAVSDGVTHNIRKGARVFVPVAQKMDTAC